MNIIIEKENKGRIIDGIDTILNLNDNDFEEVVERLNNFFENINFFYTTDKCEMPSAVIQIGLEKAFDESGNYISRFYFGGERFTISEIFEKLADELKYVKEDNEEYIRIGKLLKTRNLEAFKTSISGGKEENRILIDKVFEILLNDEIKQKFLDYDNNKDYFSINGEEVELREYLKYLGKIFGNKDKSGNLTNKNKISKDFYIPELDEYKARYSEIFDKINMDRYINPTYEFKCFTTLEHGADTIIRKNEEPDWRINKELSEEVLQKMPKDLSLEEQAMYIYCKLCKELTYDEGYFYREYLNDGRYNDTFSQEDLENIKPGSKITCWDFSRIFSKMINELDGDIESVIISRGGNGGHFLTGFYTDKVSIMLEAINSRTGGTNDLMKAKNGIEFEGIEIVSDRNGIIKQAIEKVYPQVFERNQSTIEEYIQKLRSIDKEEVPNNLKLKLESFIEIMKQNNILGNEAIQTLYTYYHCGFFGEELEKAFLGKEEYQDGKKSYRRMVLIRNKNEIRENSENSDLYLLDSDTLELSTCTAQEIMDKLRTGEFIYESEKHKMPGIDMEER